MKDARILDEYRNTCIEYEDRYKGFSRHKSFGLNDIDFRMKDK